MKSLSSKVLSLSLAQGILTLVQLTSGVFFSRLLSTSEYGTYLQTFLAYDFVVPILTLGLPTSLYYLLPRNQNKRQLIFDVIIILTISGIVFSAFLMLGGNSLLANKFNNPKLITTLNMIIFYPLYSFPLLISSTVWVSQNKIKINTLFNVTTGLLLSICLIISVVWSRNYETPILVRIVLPILFLPIGLYFIFHNTDGEINFPNIKSVYKIIRFSLPLGIASIFSTLALQFSGIIVSLTSNPTEFAIYTNGAKELPFIGIITGSISVVIMSDMSQKIKDGNYSNALYTFKKAALISASFLYPLMIFLLIYGNEFINILYSEKYSLSVIPFRIYLLNLVIRIIYYGSALIAFGETRAILIRSVFDLLLTIIFCYIFVYFFGFYGAAIGLVLTLFIWTVPFNLITLSKKFNCDIKEILPFYKLFKILCIASISGICSSLIYQLNLNEMLTFILGFCLFTIIYISFSFKFNSEFSFFLKTKFNIQRIWN